MSEAQEQAKFDGWAVVEVMGHHVYAGYVTTEAYGQAVLFRVDVPALEERERVTETMEWIGAQRVPAGTIVTEGGIQGFTKLIGAGSIYAITPCTREAALAKIESSVRRPLMQVDLPKRLTLLESGLEAEESGAGDDHEGYEL